MSELPPAAKQAFKLSTDAVRRAVALVRPQDDLDDEQTRELFARIAASVLTEPGDSVWGSYVAHFGAAVVLDALVSATSPSEFASALGFPADATLSAAWQRWVPRLRSELVIGAAEHAAQVSARVCIPGDEDWPGGLDDLGPFAPHCLYQRGASDTEWRRAIAMVGARASTGYGEHVASEIAGELAASGTLIVSGAAYGIDGIAHRAALAEEAPTVAVLAGGIDRFYPSGHSELLQRICADGRVLSESPCGTAPSKWRFLQRNRLIAAASRATVVVEAGVRSGSLNTAGHAAAIGRPLGAVPGPVTSPASAGCHRLLREYDAVCVTSARDVQELAFGALPSADTERTDPAAQRVRDALGRSAQTIEQIAAAAGFSVAETSGRLAEGELAGWARSTPTGWIRDTQKP